MDPPIHTGQTAIESSSRTGQSPQKVQAHKQTLLWTMEGRKNSTRLSRSISTEGIHTELSLSGVATTLIFIAGADVVCSFAMHAKIGKFGSISFSSTFRHRGSCAGVKLSNELQEIVSSALLLARWFEHRTGGVKADTSGDGCHDVGERQHLTGRIKNHWWCWCETLLHHRWVRLWSWC